MAYSENFPAQRASFMADFANAGRLDNRISFTRASTGTYFGTEKVLSSENILLQSQTLDTTWAAVDVAAPTGSQTAPDGTSTAWLLTADSASSQAPYVRQSPTFSGSTQYTMVGHLKAGTASHGYISFRTQNGYSAYALLDFSGGTVSHAGFGDFTGVSSSVTALGSSWFKVTLTATTGSNLSGSNVLVGISDGTTPTSAGYATWTSAGETMYAWGIQLATTNAKVYDSPTTTQIARSYQTKLQTAASGVARFEHSATDGQSVAKGISIESQATNINTYAKGGVNGSGVVQWAASAGTATGNSAVGPDGTLSALHYAPDTTSAAHYIYNNVGSAPSGSTPHTISVYAKAAGETSIVIRLTSSYSAFANTIDASFTLTGDGSVSVTGGTATAAIESCGNGWYRCQVTETTASSPTLMRPYVYVRQIASYAGDGYSGVILWGWQVEANSFASSFVDTGTSGSTATRAAEELSMDLTQAGFNGGPVSVITETTAGLGSYPRTFSLSDGTNTNYANIHRNGTETDTSTDYRVRLFTDGASQVNRTASGSASATKIGMSIDTNSVISTFDGGSSETDTSAVINTMTLLRIGDQPVTGKQLNGTCKRVAVYGTALSQTELEALTS